MNELQVQQLDDAAIRQYNKIIKLCDRVDYVTKDLCITALAGEETHCREFRGAWPDMSIEPLTRETLEKS